jgi:hypothetical protein
VNSRKLGEIGLGPKLPYLALINLGFASSLFHSSLKYSTQMCDEFSMLIATFIVFYRVLSFSQTWVSPRVLMASLCLLMGFVMVAQIKTGESTVQQIVFTGMVYWLWHFCFRSIGKLGLEKELRGKMRWMAISGIGMLFNLLFLNNLPTILHTNLTFFVESFLCLRAHVLDDGFLCMRWSPRDTEKNRNALGGRTRIPWLVCFPLLSRTARS